jgi:hypothetical protein
MAKYVAKLVAFEVETAVAATFAPVPQVASVELPQADTEEVEVTTLDNAGSTREFLQGFIDGGEATLEVVFDPAVHVTGTDSIWSLYKSGVTKNWRLVLPAAMGSNYEFSAYVRNAGLMTVTPGQAIRLNATLRVSGAAGDFVDTVVTGLSADDQAAREDLRNREARPKEVVRQ